MLERQPRPAQELMGSALTQQPARSGVTASPLHHYYSDEYEVQGLGPWRGFGAAPQPSFAPAANGVAAGL